MTENDIVETMYGVHKIGFINLLKQQTSSFHSTGMFVNKQFRCTLWPYNNDMYDLQRTLQTGHIIIMMSGYSYARSIIL